QFQTLSQKYTQIDAFVGKGDTLKTYIEIGYRFRVNDSLQNNILQNVSNAHSFYAKSQLFKTKTSDLSVYANYRHLKYTDTGMTEPTLNSRIAYNDRYFKNLIQTNSIYETSSGSDRKTIHFKTIFYKMFQMPIPFTPNRNFLKPKPVIYLFTPITGI